MNYPKPHIHGFNRHPSFIDYEVCQICGSMHRINDVAPESIYESGYWSREGFSTIPEQVYNVAGFKNEKGETKIDVIMKHVSTGSHALELACAPGSLVKKLRENYEHVVGVEVDETYRSQILDVIQGSGALVFGKFPEISKHWPEKSYDLIVAMDLFEHIEDQEAFMNEVLRLLKDEGTVILMSPFISDVRELDKNQFIPEHVWLPSEGFMKEWFGLLFEEVTTDIWIKNHNVIVGKKKKDQQKEAAENQPVDLALSEPSSEENVQEEKKEDAVESPVPLEKKARKPRKSKEVSTE